MTRNEVFNPKSLPPKRLMSTGIQHDKNANHTKVENHSVLFVQIHSDTISRIGYRSSEQHSQV